MESGWVLTTSFKSRGSSHPPTARRAWRYECSLAGAAGNSTGVLCSGPDATSVALTACATLGEEGEACTTDADCADGLECHIEEHEEDGDTAADEDHDDHEEGGVCEAHDEDHEGHDHD